MTRPAFLETVLRFYRRRVSAPDPGSLSLPSASPLPEGHAVAFIHVPRTGGTSIESVFTVELGPRVLFQDGVHEVARNTAGASYASLLHALSELYNGRRVLTGHIDGNDPLVTQFPRTIHAIAAVMRDPEARAVSLYNYARSTPGHPAFAALQGKNLLRAIRDVPDFAANVLSNEQMRQIFLTDSLGEAEEKMRKGRYLIGRFDRLELFAHTLFQGVLGLPDAVTLPRLNMKEHQTLPAGNIQLLEQTDLEDALALVREHARGDGELYRRLPPAFVSPKLLAPA